MKIRNVLLIASLFLTVGCSSPKEVVDVSMLAPQGATALAGLAFVDDEHVKTTYVAGTDVITAELAKADPSHDIIIAPINLGTKMMEKGNSNYRLAAIITWGNLYVVGTSDYQSGDAFAAFGENAVPGMILANSGLEVETTYYNAVQDVQAQLISGKVKAGLLAEPTATATIAKAKAQGIELQVLQDMQQLYQTEKQSASTGYPQAAIFVKEGSEDNVKDALASMETFTNETVMKQPEVIAERLAKVGNDNLGVPASEIVSASWERQHIKYVEASDVQTEITTFLKLFNITFQESMLSK